MSEQYPSSGGPPDDPSQASGYSKIPELAPEDMARHLVAEVDDIAIDIIEAQIAYWTETLEEARQELAERNESDFL